MLRELIARLWEGRFRHGIGVCMWDGGVTKFNNGEFLGITHLGTIVSQSTGHWPWHVFEAGYCTGARRSWHIGVLGFTVGKLIVNNTDIKTGEIVGPDKNKYYWFFKGLNHQDKQLEEII